MFERGQANRRVARVVLAAAIVAGSALAVVPGGAAFASGNWSPPTPADPGATVSSVSCPTVKFCVAVDGAGNAVIHKRNNTWEAPNPIDVGDGGFTSVSCVSALLCMAVDAAGNERRYANGTWFRALSIDPGVAINAISCFRGQSCVAVDAAGSVLAYNGVSWSAPAAVDAPHALTALSCPTPTFCAAVDDNAGALTFNGFTWSGPIPIDLGSTVEALSCASSSLCVAVDDHGNAVSYHGLGWSLPTSVDPGHALRSVSCPTSGGLCVAVDDHGDALTYDGTAWSAPSTIDSTHALVALSCPTVNFCVAVDALGDALTFPPPLAITTTSLPGATAGHTYTATVGATGGNPPYRWLASLPRGLRISRTTGVISGIPRRTGTYTFKVTVRDQKIRISHRVPSQDRAWVLLSLTVS
jgi:Putative Ig domain